MRRMASCIVAGNIVSHLESLLVCGFLQSKAHYELGIQSQDLMQQTNDSPVRCWTNKSAMMESRTSTGVRTVAFSKEDVNLN